ncbi:hypothetical protein Q8A67_022235 [Cirrhinus molitorella]|uniref:UPAR/Ly6 domain-containing protein n=1 Tax=Cirrhinus molitorella TaxID=172907 RepID=A0AA88P663_9TELE|nr:hypothetical protein Q8A67_022235 [Cirrhinus molitorella]
MDLDISVFLLFVLFTAGHSLSCYNCTNALGSCNQTSQCPTGFTNCISETSIVNGTTVKVKSCFASVCPSGSINLGIKKNSSVCCSTDLCNAQDAPDPSNNTSNGNKCYYCDEQNCSNTVSCSGSEDRCVTVTGHSLSCYQCTGTTSGSCVQRTCYNESFSCIAATSYNGDNKTVAKDCFLSNGCPTGSVNLGNIKASLNCCSTDLCNAQDAPDPKEIASNGKMCYYCDGQNCSKTLNCSGTEDRCLTQTGENLD